MKKEYYVRLTDKKGTGGNYHIILPYYMPVPVVSDILQTEAGCGMDALAGCLNRKYGWVMKGLPDGSDWDWFQVLNP